MIRKLIIILTLSLASTSQAGDITNDQNLLKQKKECLSKEGYIWNESLNSCQINFKIESAENKTDSCESSDCYINNSSDATSVSSSDTYKGSSLEIMGKLAAGAYLAFSKFATHSIGKKAGELVPQQNFAKGKVKIPGATCASKTLFKLTSAAWVAGDLFLKYSLKKKLKKLESEYKAEIENDNQQGGENGYYQAQVRAFHYLLEEQKIIYHQAQQRKVLQMSVGGGYTSAGAMAIYEMTPAGSVSSCYINKVDAPERLPLPPKNGQKIKGEFLKKFLTFGSSAQIALVSGLMGGLNLAIMKHASDEEGRSLENIKTIQEVMSGYQQFKSGLCPNGRDDLTNPQCYCYDSNRKESPSRTKSAMCQRLFAYSKINYGEQIKKKRIPTENMVCITINGKVDRDCKCKTMINTSEGTNACAHVAPQSFFTGGFPSASSITSIVGPLNKLSTGAGSALGTLNTSTASKSAGRIKGLAMQIKKNEKLKNYPSQAYFKNYANKVASAIPILKARDSDLSPLMTNFAPISQLTKNTVDGALNELKNEESDPSSVGVEFKSSGKGKMLANRLQNAMSWNNSRLKDSEIVLDMIKNGNEKDFGDNDIAKDNNHSIFEILSRRYQITGMKRLFE